MVAPFWSIAFEAGAALGELDGAGLHARVGHAHRTEEPGRERSRGAEAAGQRHSQGPENPGGRAHQPSSGRNVFRCSLMPRAPTSEAKPSAKSSLLSRRVRKP